MTLVEITSEQLDGILRIVSDLYHVDLTEEQRILRGEGSPPSESVPVGPQIPKKSSLLLETSKSTAPSQQDVQNAASSADDKSKLTGIDFLIALAKQYPVLASLLFVLVVVAGIATAAPSFPLIGTIVLWIAAASVAAVFVTALVNFLKGTALSPVSAYCNAIKYESNKNCEGSKTPPPKIHLTYWDLWLKCDKSLEEFYVGYGGKVAPMASTNP